MKERSRAAMVMVVAASAQHTCQETKASATLPRILDKRKTETVTSSQVITKVGLISTQSPCEKVSK